MACASQTGAVVKPPAAEQLCFFCLFFFQEKNCHFTTIQFKFGTFEPWFSIFFGPEPNFKPQSLQEPQPNKQKILISLVQLLQVFILLSY